MGRKASKMGESPNQVVITGIMDEVESAMWYRFKGSHYDSETGLLATGFPGKNGRYKVRILGKYYWIFYSLLYTAGKLFRGTTEGQVIVRKEMFEDQNIYMVASEQEPLYIKGMLLILPSGYRQKVRLSYYLCDDINTLWIRGKSGE